MKIKVFLSAAVIGAAMTACTSDEVVLTPETVQTPISFNAVTSNLTRAAASYDQPNPPDNFVVWAFMKDASGAFLNYFKEGQPAFVGGKLQDDGCDAITKNGENWTGTKTRYWPKYTPLTFFAFIGMNNGVYPTVGFSSSSYTSEEYFTASFTYNVPTSSASSNTPSSQADLLYAVAKNKKGSESNVVNLEFKHLLSQICFEAENQDNSTQYQIYQITLKNVVPQGKCTISYILNSNNDTSPYWDYSEYSDNKVDYLVALSGLPTLYGTASVDYNNNIYKYTKLNISIPNKQNTDSDYGNSEERAKYVERAFNLIPQNTSGVNIEVQFSANGGLTETKTIPITANWTSGTRYVYKLIFKPGAEISYNVTCLDYTTPENDNFTGDKNVE